MKYSTRLITFCVFGFILLNCSAGSENQVEKIQSNRSEVISVKNKILDIPTEVILGNPLLYISDDFLIAVEMKPSQKKGIHIFDKQTFKHIASTGIVGSGPGEIIRFGRIGVDNKNRTFWVQDHGKQMMMKFSIDSVLSNEMYKPTEGIPLNTDFFMERFNLLNDSIALGKAVDVLTTSTYQMTMAKLNVITNKIERYGYELPEVLKKKANSHFKLSIPNKRYVNCYVNFDLMTICNLDGSLICNVFGTDQLENDNYKKVYFTGVDIIGQYIIASYVGDQSIIINDYKRQQGNLPSKFLVFDYNGNYVKTLETSYKFSTFCVDNDNKRIIAYYADRNNENPLAYFSLDLD